MALIDIDWRPGPKQLRQFAGMFLVFFLAAGTLAWWRDKPLWLCETLWNTAWIVGIPGLLFPRLVWPVYVAMMAVALPIGMVVSTLLMTAIFFLVITPIGLLMRLSGYDPMRRRFDPGAVTYWIERPATSDVRRYFRQH